MVRFDSVDALIEQMHTDSAEAGALGGGLAGDEEPERDLLRVERVLEQLLHEVAQDPLVERALELDGPVAAGPEFEQPAAVGLGVQRDGDELVFEVPEDEVEKTLPVVTKVMEDAPMPALALSVPLQVDARAAHNWDDAH